MRQDLRGDRPADRPNAPCHPCPAALDEKALVSPCVFARSGAKSLPSRRPWPRFPHSINSIAWSSKSAPRSSSIPRAARQAGLARGAGGRHRRAASAGARTCWSCRPARSRSGARSPDCRRAPLKLEDSQAVGRDRADRAVERLVAGAPRACDRRRPGASDSAGYGRAPPLSQRPRDARPPDRDARRPDHQRERHGRNQRDPLRRQRPSRRPRRHHGERRSSDPALRRRRPLRLPAASDNAAREAPARRRARDARDRGDGGRSGVGTVARRHAHQDRGRPHRDGGRHAHGHR